MDGIQVTKPEGIKCNRIIDAVVKILKHKKISIDHAININIFSDVIYPILQFILIMFLILIKMRQIFLNFKSCLKNNLRLNSKKYLSLNTQIFLFLNILLDSVFIRLVTSWIWPNNGYHMENLEKFMYLFEWNPYMKRNS